MLVGDNKLYPSDLAIIQQRHAFLYRTAQWRYERDRAEYLAHHGQAARYEAFLQELNARFARNKPGSTDISASSPNRIDRRCWRKEISKPSAIRRANL